MVRKSTGPRLSSTSTAAKAPEELTFADVPADLRPSSFARVWLSVVPLRPDETDERHCSLAFGLSVDEGDRERSVGRTLAVDSHWRTKLAQEAHAEAYRAWLADNGLADLVRSNGAPTGAWSMQSFRRWDEARRGI
ncbi:hypothetical protein [Gordonia sp. 852002-50395_SCH5434458]|uniref:hypothetical protein n=1 Tax=Gordonia sp. 852002-50395_SCH5434458 TaxID=1834090 RepID=UPI0007EB5CA7|nr:hypothetical protein [Gordonia sp. 852002-50395_SCH5434458]OBC00497.1 hypothetical protein A5785_19040 [Gordonia sp. 852002-50395_SCH5434458]